MMGGVTSRIVYRALKPFREYNFYERAHKAAIANKNVPSPRHPSTENVIRKSIESKYSQHL